MFKVGNILAHYDQDGLNFAVMVTRSPTEPGGTFRAILLAKFGYDHGEVGVDSGCWDSRDISWIPITNVGFNKALKKRIYKERPELLLKEVTQ